MTTKPTIYNQYSNELSASVFYLVASNKATILGFNGVAKYFLKLSSEEIEHAKMVVEYLNKRNMPVSYNVEVDAECGETIEQIIYTMLAKEQYIKTCLDTIYQSACEAGDYQTKVFISDMIKEQIDGVDEAKTIVDKLKLSTGNLIQFDNYMEGL